MSVKDPVETKKLFVENPVAIRTLDKARDDLDDLNTSIIVLLPDFLFRQVRRLDFQTSGCTNKNTETLLATSSKHGVTIVAQSNLIHVVETKTFLELDKVSKDVKRHDVVDFPRNSVTTVGNVTHICLSADEALLFVAVEKDGVPVAQLYATKELSKKNPSILNEIRLSNSPGTHLVEMKWNPGEVSTFSACTSDGVVGIYVIKGASVELCTSPPSMAASSLAWSPKGKQIVIGRTDGQVFQCKPDLSVVKKIPPPDVFPAGAVVGLLWVSNFQFVAVYTHREESRPFLCVINTPKNAAIQYIAYDDICYGGAEGECRYSFHHIPDWGLIICCSATAIELAVLASDGPDSWVALTLEDSGRAELPLKDGEETYPVGFSMDYSNNEPLPFGENQSLPAVPIAVVLSSAGVLCPFHLMYFKDGIPKLTNPPAEPLKIEASSSVAPKTAVHQPPIQPQVPAPPPQALAPAVPAFAPAAVPAFAPGAVPAFAPAAAQAKPPGGSLFSGFNPPKQTAAASASGEIKPAGVLFGALGSSVSAQVPAVPFSQPKTTASGDPRSGGLFGASGGTAAAQAAQFGVKPAASVAQALSVIRQEAVSAVPVSKVEPVKQAVAAVPSKVSSEAKDQALKKLMGQIQKELSDFKSKISNLKADIGTDDDKKMIGTSIYQLERFNKDLKQTLQAQETELRFLKTDTIEMVSWAEDCQSRVEKRSDPRYIRLLHLRGLDPGSKKMMKKIDDLHRYLSVGIDQVHRTLEATSSDPRSAPLQIPDADYVYRSLVTMERIVSEERMKVMQAEALVKKVRERKDERRRDKVDHNRTLEDLEKSLRESQIASPEKPRRIALPPTAFSPKIQARIKAQLQSQPMLRTQAEAQKPAPTRGIAKYEDITPEESPTKPAAPVAPASMLMTSTPKVPAVGGLKTPASIRIALFKDEETKPQAIPTFPKSEPALNKVIFGFSEVAVTKAPTVPSGSLFGQSLSTSSSKPPEPPKTTAPSMFAHLGSATVEGKQPAIAKSSEQAKANSASIFANFGGATVESKLLSGTTTKAGELPKTGASSIFSNFGSAALSKAAAATSLETTKLFPTVTPTATAGAAAQPSLFSIPRSGAETTKPDVKAPTSELPTTQSTGEKPPLFGFAATSSTAVKPPAFGSATATTTQTSGSGATTVTPVGAKPPVFGFGTLVQTPTTAATSTTQPSKPLAFGFGTAPTTTIKAAEKPSAFAITLTPITSSAGAVPSETKSFGSIFGLTAADKAQAGVTATVAVTTSTTSAPAFAFGSSAVTSVSAAPQDLTTTQSSVPTSAFAFGKTPVEAPKTTQTQLFGAAPFGSTTKDTTAPLLGSVVKDAAAPLFEATAKGVAAPFFGSVAGKAEHFDSKLAVSGAEVTVIKTEPTESSKVESTVGPAVEVKAEDPKKTDEVKTEVEKISLPEITLPKTEDLISELLEAPEEPKPELPKTAAPSAGFGLAPAAVSSIATSAASNTPASTVTSIFGKPAETTTAFGQPSPAKPSIFSAFGQTATSTSAPAFGQVATTGASVFGQPAATATQSSFGQAAPATTSIFGQPATTGFGQPAATASGFGQASSAATGFGVASTTASIFGQPQATTGFGGVATSTPSVFGQPAQSGGGFGTTGFGTATGLGQPPAFGQAAPPAFGQSTGFGQAPAFGQAQTTGFGTKAAAETAQSIFGKPAGFGQQPQGTSGGNIFGGATSFGQTQQKTGAFGAAAATGGGVTSGFGAFGLGGKPSEENKNRNVFGGGTFGSAAPQTANIFGGSAASPAAQPVFGGGMNQTTPTKPSGFGTSGFGGGLGASKFGAAPAFGASPAFGSPPAFGAASPSTFGGAANTSGSNVFATFAAQSTPTFGSLASTPQSGFGTQQQQSGFGQQSSFGEQIGAEKQHKQWVSYQTVKVPPSKD